MNTMVEIKSFHALSAAELYEILKARSDVFGMEQEILYQDMDDIDYRAMHFFIRDECGLVIAYARAFGEEGHPGMLHVGRVLTITRGKGYGVAIMEAIRKWAKENGFGRIELDAQTQVEGFYAALGYETISEEYQIDGIPHVRMRFVL